MNLKSWTCAAFGVCLVASLTFAFQDTSSQTATKAPARGPRPPALSSEELAKQPQTSGATGEQQRHYYFTEGKVESPYHIYVPKKYDSKTKWPLIIALHGAGDREDYFFRHANGTPEVLEKYGFILASPFGYHEFGGYGAGVMPRVPVPTYPGVAPNPVTARRPQWSPEETAHVNELSEKDVLNVLALMEKEYNIDTTRVYLMGHSMGGMGTWYLGQKYADKCAALGVLSGGFGYQNYPLERLKGIPIIAAAGSMDQALHGEEAKTEVARFKAAGLNITYVEIPGGTHMSMIPPMFPQVIEFFSTHHR